MGTGTHFGDYGVGLEGDLVVEGAVNYAFAIVTS